MRRDEELQRRKKLYLEEHIYAGLEGLPSPPSDLDGDDSQTDEDANIAHSGWFSAEELAVVLNRYLERKIKITMMQHRSADGELDRLETRNIKAPLALLAKWEAEGCCEKFYAFGRVPDSLVS